MSRATCCMWCLCAWTTTNECKQAQWEGDLCVRRIGCNVKGRRLRWYGACDAKEDGGGIKRCEVQKVDVEPVEEGDTSEDLGGWSGENRLQDVEPHGGDDKRHCSDWRKPAHLCKLGETNVKILVGRLMCVPVRLYQMPTYDCLMLTPSYFFVTHPLFYSLSCVSCVPRDALGSCSLYHIDNLCKVVIGPSKAPLSLAHNLFCYSLNLSDLSVANSHTLYLITHKYRSFFFILWGRKRSH